MDTVSYLTINDETKEIADRASRNNIDNITATLATYRSDIDDIQYETGPQGSIAASISNTYSLAYSAQAGAVAATEAAALADEKAANAAQAANTALAHADNASIAAANAWDRAGEAKIAAIEAEGKAESASNAASAAWDQADSAASAAANAWNRANDAASAAQLADIKADAAASAADAAGISARQANTYAQGALAGMSTLESVIDTVNWFADHRTLTTDTTVNPQKNYYTYNEATGTMSKAELFGTENPQELGLYELDETIQNYVASRIAETNDGLYISSLGNGWRVLVSPGTGNYVPGIFLIDDNGVIKQSTTGAGISFDDSTPFYIGNEDAYLTFARNNNNEGVIDIGGDNVNIHGAVTMGGNKTLSQVLNDLDSSIISVEYGVGDSSTSHSDIYIWSTTTPEWQEDKYIWMRTSTNGQTYTYTCIQGAQGPPGEKGDTGEQGEPGLDGLGILSVEVFYAISNSSEIIPGDDEWKTSLDQWYSYYEYGESGEEYEYGESGEEYIEEGESGESGEDNFSRDDLLNLPKGSWLWVKTETTYSDFTSSVSYQKSYIGTDGQDGSSVFIQNVVRDESTGTTTVTLVDGKGTTTELTIKDGEDGANGIPGTSGYIHIAWADNIEINQDESINATGFSVDNSTDKAYMGVYTDNIENDSNDPSAYSWSLIKGPEGPAGQDAIHVEIDSIGGNFIKSGQTGVSLVAHVYEGINDITNQFSNFIWYRRKADGTRDTSWSTQETSNQLHITTADVDESAVFVCEVTVTR